MGPIQRLLFGRFPRSVGVSSDSGGLRQFCVHSVGELNNVIEYNNGKRNIYSSISWRPVGGLPRVSKIYYDFDSEEKENDWEIFGGVKPPEDEIMSRMRADNGVANAILGRVVSDSRALVRRSVEEDIPVIGVFSGLGIHVYQLYREKVNPDKQIDTTGRMYIGDLNLKTADIRPMGDVKRISRMPNVERVHHEVNDDGELVARRGTGCYMIPLLPEDFEGLTPAKLISMADSPRAVEPPEIGERPELKTQERYVDKFDEAPEEAARRRVGDVASGSDGWIEHLIDSWIRLPCMRQRILTSEPDHEVRQNCAVLLFNIGMTVDEVFELYRSIGWSDWNPTITRNQLEQIYKRGYADWRCDSIRANGLCVYDNEEEQKECPTFEWSGGCSEWLTR